MSGEWERESEGLLHGHKNWIKLFGWFTFYTMIFCKILTRETVRAFCYCFLKQFSVKKKKKKKYKKNKKNIFGSSFLIVLKNIKNI